MPDWFDQHAAAQVAARRESRLRAHQVVANGKANWPAQLAMLVSDTVQVLRERQLPVETWEFWYHDDEWVPPRGSFRAALRPARTKPDGINLYRRSVRSWPAPRGLAIWSDGAEVPLLLTKDGRLCWARHVASHARDWQPEHPTGDPVEHCEDAPSGARCLVREGEITLGGFGYVVGLIDDRVVVQVLRADVADDEPETTCLDLTAVLTAWADHAARLPRRGAAALTPGVWLPGADGARVCPVCGAAMHGYQRGDLRGERCDACGGVFLPADQLDRLLGEAGAPSHA